MPSFDWIPFYQELADKLLPFKNDRQSLVEKLKNVYAKLGFDFPKMKLEEEDDDEIDPFTVFGMFNKISSRIRRIKIAHGIAEALDVQKEVPKEFDGVPRLFPLQAIVFRWNLPSRIKESEALWTIFAAAIVYADSKTSLNRKTFIDAYNVVKDMKGLKWRLSTGLFWARPLSYLSLDSPTRKFLTNAKDIFREDSGVIPQITEPPCGELYLETCDLIRNYIASNKGSFSSFPDMSYRAFEAEYGSDSAELDEAKRYWLYAPGANADHWEEFYKKGIMAIGWEEIGDLSQFSSQKEIQDAMKRAFGSDKSYTQASHMTWQFANVIKPGDVVFVKKGTSALVGRGEITEDSTYYYDDAKPDFNNVRRIKWTHKGEWSLPQPGPLKTLTDITDFTYMVEPIEEYFVDEYSDKKNPQIIEAVKNPPYNSGDFLNEVYMDADDYRRLIAVLKAKKNVVLQGAPGVGKTFAAKRLAYSMMGEKDEERVAMVQFHQSYSYEDFIMGFRPTENGFKLNRGAFYEFCKKAEEDPDNEYFFIIDEINRGNLSKIFGELFMLIERDKRGVELRILYSNEKFSVPRNVYLIGMMNTADRSLAMLDFALRRRFAFFELKPGFETEGFGEYQKRLASKKFDALIGVVKKLNETIESDDSLGKGFCIGRGFFCGLTPESVDARLANIVDYELIPLLQEYWYDEPLNVDEWAGNLRAAIQ